MRITKGHAFTVMALCGLTACSADQPPRLFPGIEIASPTIIAASLAVALTTESYPKSTYPVLQLEAGLRSGKISLGWGAVEGDPGTPVPVGGMVMSLSVLKTWREPHNLASDQVFVGPEAKVVTYGVGCHLGVFRRVSGPEVGDEWKVFGGLSLGF